MNRLVFGTAALLAVVAFLLAALFGPRAGRHRVPAGQVVASRETTPPTARAARSFTATEHASDAPLGELAPIASSPLPQPPPDPPRAPDWRDTTSLGLPECDDYRAALQRYQRCPLLREYGKQLELDRWETIRGPRMQEIAGDDAEAKENLRQTCADEAKALTSAADSKVCPP